MTSRKQTSGQVGSRAKTSVLRENEQDSLAIEARLHSHSSTLWSDDDLGGWCWRTSLVCSLPTMDEISSGSSVRWTKSGTMSRGEVSMLNISESPKEEVESSLLHILNQIAPSRFYLSAKAAAGILRRAAKRGKKLPQAMEEALRAINGSQTSASSSVRRLTPTECERLMGWPDGWTIASSPSRQGTAGNQRNSTTKPIR